MLYSPSNFQRDQLLTDLLAAREKIADRWVKGAWTRAGQGVCTVAAVESAVGSQIGPHVKYETEQGTRVGRCLAALYVALYGPHAPRGIPMKAVLGSIVTFNDGAATREAVLLLFDRAIAAVTESVGATVETSA